MAGKEDYIYDNYEISLASHSEVHVMKNLNYGLRIILPRRLMHMIRAQSYV